MCDQCDGAQGKGEGADSTRLSRRAVLAMGVSAATGVVVGLWSCQKDGGREVAGTRFGSASSTTTRVAASGEGSATTRALAGTPGVATAGVAGVETRGAETQSVAATMKGSPDLGAEVFPDVMGKALAKVGDAPVIVVPRGDWAKGGPRLKEIEVMGGIEHITVHHTAGEILTDAWVPTAGELESIREFHSGSRAGDRQWADIAYHFAVDRAGRVWQARPLAYQGAHVKGHNEHNMGIVLMGNFEVQSPSAAQLTALREFVGFVRGLYGIGAGEVYTHGELGDTSCPGKTLQAFMDRWRKA